ncbi:MAG: SRPBCC family protein [Alphaproteobacteria bacterium]|nr:SRPBCC family protein [Alphaproteobacteria bacterium]MBU1525726.1 SRPBCC family protein [Alphaproteobacteria bacterium]MBU2117595.1 SRPBCC family protein [Alphaproteobacteria bacterium]MBU2351893.1 SRPBCC family protein [Alphaproteobacteria bacterium]MBU2382747.1 SRPBCC family protein [Alphaproteobacteria bacterium]
MANQTEANPCDTDGVAHGFDLVLERLIDAPPEKVFRAYTDPAILSQWFAPRPWSISDMVLEPRPGGRFNFVMHGPDGERMPNSGIYLEVVENRRIVSTDALTPDWKPAGAPFMVARIDLEPTGDGRTRYTATASHWTEAAMKQHEAMGFHEGWGQAADQLNQIVKTL